MPALRPLLDDEIVLVGRGRLAQYPVGEDALAEGLCAHLRRLPVRAVQQFENDARRWFAWVLYQLHIPCADAVRMKSCQPRRLRSRRQSRQSRYCLRTHTAEAVSTDRPVAIVATSAPVVSASMPGDSSAVAAVSARQMAVASESSPDYVFATDIGDLGNGMIFRDPLHVTSFRNRLQVRSDILAHR